MPRKSKKQQRPTTTPIATRRHWIYTTTTNKNGSHDTYLHQRVQRVLVRSVPSNFSYFKDGSLNGGECCKNYCLKYGMYGWNEIYVFCVKGALHSVWYIERIYIYVCLWYRVSWILYTSAAIIGWSYIWKWRSLLSIRMYLCQGISFKIHQLIKLCLLISKHQSISILQQWQRQVGPLKRMLVILYQRMSPMRYVLFLQYNIYNYRRFLCTIISVHIMYAQFILVIQYTLQYNH